MKLVHYTLRNLFIPLLLIFGAWGVTFYFLIIHEVNDETNDTLSNYKEMIIRSVLADSTLLQNHVDIMSRYYIREVPEQEARLDKDTFFDSTVYIDIEMEDEPVRVLRSYFMTPSGKYYELIIEISTLEKEDMIETIIWSMGILYFLLICCILFINLNVFRQSLKPLFKLLDWLKQYRLDKNNKPLDNPTRIEEFKILNETVAESVNRSSELYNKQKQFVENAAHELQTPLAVCLNKLELLSENQDCTEQILDHISGIHHTLHGIVRLNKTLLLLSRIDNKQFTEKQPICINTVLHNQLEDFKEIYEHKSLHITFAETDTFTYEMNESLASILITNLIKNAFIHNIQEGQININLSNRQLVIANTGPKQALNTEKLFNRFSKQTQKAESSGLGLAIVKSIADLYSIQIHYRFENNQHIFSLLFH